jgi:hypothetical protein
MSLENIAAGLFNFDPTRSAQIGNSMGAQMMEVALRSQQMQLDAGAKWDQAALAADRNAMSRRTQMFNEMTANLNRFDAKAKEGQAAMNNDALVSSYSGSGGGGGGGGGGSSQALYGPSSLPAYPGQGEATPAISPAVNDAQYLDAPTDGFNSAAQADPNAATPAPNLQPAPINQTATIGGATPATVDSDQASFSGAPAMPQVQDIVRSNQGQVSFSQPSAQNQTVRPNAIQMGQGGPANQAPDYGTFPDFLETDQNSRVSPQQLNGFMVKQIASSKLNGFVPRDGEQYGITTGAPEEWAKYMVGLSELESGHRTTVVGDVGRFPGNSNGLYQLSPNDAQNYGLRDRPFTMAELQDATENAKSAVAIHEKLVTEDGVIAGRKDDGGWAGASRYWGPLRRGVNPINTESARSIGQAEPQAAGLPQSSAMADGGLFPDELLPEGRAVADTRTSFQQTLEEKKETTMRLFELRRQDMELQAATAAVDPRAPNARMTLFQLGRERAAVNANLQQFEMQNKSILEREQKLSKALVDGEAALKMARDQQGAYMRTTPEAQPVIDRESMVDAYLDAEPRERIKMRTRFAEDKGLLGSFDMADDFMKNQTGDTRTWKVGGDDYTLAEIAQFYTPTNPNSIEKPDGVQTLVESNPKLKAEVMAIQGQSAPVQAPASSGAQTPTPEQSSALASEASSLF